MCIRDSLWTVTIAVMKLVFNYTYSQTKFKAVLIKVIVPFLIQVNQELKDPDFYQCCSSIHLIPLATTSSTPNRSQGSNFCTLGTIIHTRYDGEGAGVS